MAKKYMGLFGIVLLPLVIGMVIGIVIPVDFIRDQIASSLEETRGSTGHGHSHAPAAAGGSHAKIVELTETAWESMNLNTARLEKSEYTAKFDVPAFIREIPAASDLHVSSRFSGLVREVFVSEGQSVATGQPLLEIELTGDSLATAQSDLLDAQNQLSINQSEIDRLEPLIRQGGVAEKRLIELNYEHDRLKAKIETKVQELLVRGLTEEQIGKIRQSKKLLRSIVVTVPENLIPPQLNAASIMKDAPESFLVERVNVKPGTMAEAGEDLCDLAYHAVLVVEGQAYEKDLPQLREVIAEGIEVDLTIGPEEGQQLIEDVHIAYLSNHVNEHTNTYPFYVYIRNQRLFSSGKKAGLAGEFTTWRWKPGQRAHITIPQHQFTNVVIVPRDALAIDGLRHYVFRWNGKVEQEHDHDHDHDHTGKGDPGGDHEHVLVDQFQAMEVKVTYKDRRVAIIEPVKELKVGQRIAINHASELLFAMQQGGGGATHAHHGHEH